MTFDHITSSSSSSSSSSSIVNMNGTHLGVYNPAGTTVPPVGAVEGDAATNLPNLGGGIGSSSKSLSSEHMHRPSASNFVLTLPVPRASDSLSTKPSDSTSTLGSIAPSVSTSVSTKASDSNLVQRQAEFEKNFGKRISQEPLTAFSLTEGNDGSPRLPDDYMTILATQATDLQSTILVHGRLYLTRYHICFRSNIIGIITIKVHALSDIVSIKKGTTAKWIQNAVYVRVAETDENGTRVEQHYGYGSLRDRDSLYDGLMDCWKERAPKQYEAYMEREREQASEDLDEEDEDEEDDDDDTSVELDPLSTSGDTPKRTRGTEEKLKELALDVRLPLSLDQAYDLLYHNEEFINHFYGDVKKLTELRISGWTPDEAGKRRRTLNYVMHMNNSIGPKSSNCNGSETIVVDDPATSYEIESETQTPDIPSGKSFKIRTRTCLTHDILHGQSATRIHCTTQVDWTASSMLKSAITPAVIKGQKEHHRQLVHSVRDWVKAHREDFANVDADKVEIHHPESETAKVEGQDAAGDTLMETQAVVGKTYMDHAGDIWENPVMLGISALCLALLVLYTKSLM
ncbi:hypothetical protein IAR55_000695 [Kwoniella newhampshirensis]|uniref:VASt domain-containing protein n=1 Tax=Kwoniella newhampshirensis TaxID=1651941 RepID=A0AAW0Z7F9_9TREE